MTAVNVQACRTALAAAVLGLTVTISGQTYVMRSSDFIEPAIPGTPFFGVGEWTTSYDSAMARGNDDHTVLCRLFAAPVANPRIGSQLLAQWMKPDGATSVRAAIAAAGPTLGGACQAIRVTGFEAYAVYSVGSEQYIGGQYRLSIW